MSAIGAMMLWRGPWVYFVPVCDDGRRIWGEDVGPAPVWRVFLATGEDVTADRPHTGRLGSRGKRWRVVRPREEHAT